MSISRIVAVMFGLVSLLLPACDRLHEDAKEHHEEHHKIIVTSPLTKDVVVTQRYVCQIHSQRNIEVCALAAGFLLEIPIKEGQEVKKGDVMFQILPTLHQARLNAEIAEYQLAQREYMNSKALAEDVNRIISQKEVLLYESKMAKAKARMEQAQAELNFTTVRAPFDGIVDRLVKQQGSKIKEEDLLTNLSDNSVMWVYFNVPEARYLEYKAAQGRKSVNTQQLELVDSQIELVLADGSKFKYGAGNTVTVEAKFNNETGNIPFRADFPNPDRLLRHGQTGNILIQRKMKNAIVIPQKATFEILDKQFVYVVGEDHVAHQRPITILHEMDDIFVINTGLGAKEKIVLEGVRQVREGDKVDFEFRKPEEALSNQKHHAE